MIFQLLKSLLVLTGTVIGVAIGYSVATDYPNIIDVENPAATLAALLGFIGYLLCSMTGRELQMWLESKIEKTNSYELAWGSFGVLAGLVSANLLFVPVYFIMYKGYGEVKLTDKYLNSLIPLLHLVIPLGFNLLFAYLGVKIMIRYRKYQLQLSDGAYGATPKAIDTSAIIDVRFAELFRLGFLEGDIIVPRFVINELQLLADSSDDIKRSKGRKGLTNLNMLKTDFPDHVLISETDYPSIHEVDAKLVKLALEHKARLVTQDFNLKKVAELDGVQVININDLVNALKPIFISGESIHIKIIKKGKEVEQGVGFLSDGTMVVIENGGNHVGDDVKATVNNILQTSAGRMIFARIEDGVK